jgi:arylsulfatase A-like enzyme
VPVISNDFFPTFAEAAEVEVTDPAVDGESLIGLLKETSKLNRDAIYWHYPHYSPQGHWPGGAVRQGKYKLIEWYEKSIDGIDTPGAIELFDLERDAGEQHDLSKKKPALAAELYARLKNWRNAVGAQEMVRNPRYDIEEKV